MHASTPHGRLTCRSRGTSTWICTEDTLKALCSVCTLLPLGRHTGDRSPRAHARVGEPQGQTRRAESRHTQQVGERTATPSADALPRAVQTQGCARCVSDLALSSPCHPRLRCGSGSHRDLLVFRPGAPCVCHAHSVSANTAHPRPGPHSVCGKRHGAHMGLFAGQHKNRQQ